MTIYAIMEETPYSSKKAIAFFSSRAKALSYIMGAFHNTKPHGYTNSGSKEWEYDASKLFDINNWNKYCYVIGVTKLYIMALSVR